MEEFKNIKNNIEAVMATDGSAIPNPGRGAVGIVIMSTTGIILHQKYAKLPGNRVTNNVAETTAFLMGLELALEKGITYLSCFSDSMLLKNHLGGDWPVNTDALKELHKKINIVKVGFKHLELMHHRRDTPAGIIADAISRGSKFKEGVSIWKQLPEQKRMSSR